MFKTALGKDIDEVYTTEGCEVCGNGYHGRIAIHEVLIINQEIKDALSAHVRKDRLRDLVYTNEVITLLQDGLEKVIDGLTTIEELLKLIELDDDDKIAGTSQYDLKTALDYTSRATSQENKENEKIDETEILKNE